MLIFEHQAAAECESPCERKCLQIFICLVVLIMFLILILILRYLDQYFWEGIKKTHICRDVISYFGLLSSEFWARHAQREVVKIKNLDFSYWTWSTPWGHVFSLKKFCRNRALSWANSYSVLQHVKFTSSCAALFFQHFDIWGHSTTTWTTRGGGGVSQKSTPVHPGGGVPSMSTWTKT